MPIDKSNAKPWVKITVWVLTFALTFAFMGIGITYLIANWSYLFSAQNSQQQQQEPQYTDAQYIAAYEQQIADLEKRIVDDPSQENIQYLAGMNASYAAWLYQRGDVADFEHAITLVERAIELDPETHEENGRLFIEQLQNALYR